MGEGHLRGDRERRHLGDVLEPRADARVDADERDRARPADEVLDTDLVAGEAQEARVGVDDLLDAADPTTVGTLHGDPESVALVHGVVPRHRLEVVLLVDDVHTVADPGLVLADPAVLVLPVPLAVGLRRRRAVAVVDWASSMSVSVARVITSPVPILAASSVASQRVAGICASACKPATRRTCSSCGIPLGRQRAQPRRVTW